MSRVLRFERDSEMMERPVTTIPLPKHQAVQNLPFDTQDESVGVPSGPNPQDVLDEARREADRLLEEARMASERLRQEAGERGYEEGRLRAEELLRDMQASFASERALWDERRQGEEQEVVSLAQAIHTQRAKILEQALKPLPQLCMEIVRDLLRRELELVPANIEAMVQEMLRYILDSTRVEIHVSPEDYPAATAAHPVWKNAKYGEWDLVIVPDALIQPGGCEIRSDVGRLDGTLAVKLEMVQETLDAAFQGGGSHGSDTQPEPRSLV